jgi:hypothetical protein
LYGVEKEIVNAYNVLASRRTAGLTVNPIQLSEILAYIQLFGYPSVELDTFVDLIGVLDRRFMELQSGDNSSS